MLANVGAMLASYLLFEGISAFAENYNGDPEAAVAKALQNQAAESQFGALQEFSRPSRVGEFMGKTFSGIAPQKSLTEMAMMRNGLYDRTDPDNTPVLNFVSSKLGITPDEFAQRTSPTRMGDLSGITKSLQPQMMEMPNNG